jgi:phosphatidylcholine synthase
MMDIKTKAYLVHMLTASGAVFAMLALMDAVKGDWAMMFVWLMVAFAVDGIDGPLARKTNVTVNAARLDGTVLDTIIDYLTYVIIPAFALFQSGLLPGWTGWVAIIAITFLSAIYFADTRMKTSDYSFSGFPACWNMVVIVLFAIKPDFWVSLIIVLVLAVAMLLPIKFVHPFRTERWRRITLPVAFAWTLFAIWAAWVDFDPQSWAHWGLIATTLWLMLAGAVQQVMYRETL